MNINDILTINHIEYEVTAVCPCGPNVASYGWTHTIVVQKLGGRVLFSAAYNETTGVVSTLTRVGR